MCSIATGSRNKSVHKVMDLASFVLVVLVVFVWSTKTYMPAIEGRFWPVTTHAEISNPRPHSPPEYQFRWDATAEKLRGCEYLRTEWFLGRRGEDSVRTIASFIDPPQVRGKGVLAWSGLVIALAKEQVMQNSHGNVIHQCPGRWWETITPFFDSPEGMN